MKVVMIPGLEAALKALAEEGKIPLDADGKIPDGYIPAIIVRKDDLAGYLKAVPAPTTTTLGGYKADKRQRTDDKGGNRRLLTRRTFQATQWIGIVAGKERESVAAAIWRRG